SGSRLGRVIEIPQELLFPVVEWALRSLCLCQDFSDKLGSSFRPKRRHHVGGTLINPTVRSAALSELRSRVLGSGKEGRILAEQRGAAARHKNGVPVGIDMDRVFLLVRNVVDFPLDLGSTEQALLPCHRTPEHQK